MNAAIAFPLPLVCGSHPDCTEELTPCAACGTPHCGEHLYVYREPPFDGQELICRCTECRDVGRVPANPYLAAYRQVEAIRRWDDEPHEDFDDLDSGIWEEDQ